MRFSSTAAYWPARPICARSAAASLTTSSPATRAVPPSGGSSVVRMRTAVVLPAPFGPSRPRIVPAGATRSMPSSAVTSSNACGVPPPRSLLRTSNPLYGSSRIECVRCRPLNISDPEFTYDAEDPEGYRAGMFRHRARRGRRAHRHDALPPPARRAPVPVPLRVRGGGMAARPRRPAVPAHARRHRASSSRWTSRSSRAARTAPTRSATATDEPARVLMWSKVTYPSATSYPDSDKVGVWTGVQARGPDRGAVRERRLLPRREAVAPGRLARRCASFPRAGRRAARAHATARRAPAAAPCRA